LSGWTSSFSFVGKYFASSRIPWLLDFGKKRMTGPVIASGHARAMKLLNRRFQARFDRRATHLAWSSFRRVLLKLTP
jgi:hypothetical protein